ncbi:MAG: hypothetical protein KDJ63_09150 [Nitratireductor sp.]|nr:hypothetical protein [Nitratireductor sp.]
MKTTAFGKQLNSSMHFDLAVYVKIEIAPACRVLSLQDGYPANLNQTNRQDFPDQSHQSRKAKIT